MASKNENAKTTKKSTTNNAKKATTKKAATKKTTAKKVETKKTETKPVVKKEVKTTTKKAATKKTVAPVKETKKVEVQVTKKEAKKANSLVAWFKEKAVIIGLVLISILLIVNIVIVVNGHKVKLSDGKEIIANIGEKEIIAEDLFDDLKEKYGTDALLMLVDSYILNKDLTDDEKVEAKSLAQENVEGIREQYESAGYKWEEVLTQYNYENEDALLDEFKLSFEKEIIAKRYIADELKEEDIEKYYEENVFGKYTAKHILIVPDTTDTMTNEEKAAAEEAAKNRAQEVINKLNEGAEWNTLVKEYSEDTGSVEDNGLVENFTKGDVVDEFWNAVGKLKDNKYTSEPVKSSYGYHIIYRVSYTEKEKLKDIKEDLVDEIVVAKLNEDANLYTSTWASIRKEYDFEINDTTIKTSYEKAITAKNE